MQCSFAAAEHQVIEVVGTGGAITVPLAFTAWRDDMTILLIQRGPAFEQKESAPADPYQLMVAHFTECVLERKPLLYPPEDGRATLRVLDMLRDRASQKSQSSSFLGSSPPPQGDRNENSCEALSKGTGGKQTLWICAKMNGTEHSNPTQSKRHGRRAG